jgi:hypothetical protein
MKFQLPLLLALATSLSAVPSDINYQGRLTDANGDAVTGDVSMSVKMYDAQSGGNEIYSEDIGTVTLDENGVYSFQFGASGNSTVTKTETIVTSDGSSTEYTGTFTSTPIDGTISVTDETYSWNDIDGNPGEQATAYIIIINGFVIFADIENGGSGYDDDNPPLVTITGDGSGATATATVEGGIITGITIDVPGTQYTEGDIAIAPPPAPFTVDKVDGNLEVGYASSPSNGTGVVTTYKTLEPSIIGALSEASSHWLELTVDGTKQNPRERILSVPFAQVAGSIPNSAQNSQNFVEYGQIYLDGSKDRENGNSENFDSKNYSSVTLNDGDRLIITGSYYANGAGVADIYEPLSLEKNGSIYRIKKNNFNNVDHEIVGPGLVYAVARNPSAHTNTTRVLTFYKIIRSNYSNNSFEDDEFTYELLDYGGEAIVLESGDYLELIAFHETGNGNPLFYVQVDGFTYEIKLNNSYDRFGICGPARITPAQNNGAAMSYKIYRSPTISSNPYSNGVAQNSGDSYENSTFQIIDGNYSWEEARIDAESRGGRLAILDTLDKINSAKAFIIDMTTNDYIPKVWIGCTDQVSEGQWLWIDGTSVTHNDWRPGQPDNHGGGNQHYASFTDNAVWDDAQLNWVWSNGYLLEMD